jgi:hypothetical protein
MCSLAHPSPIGKHGQSLEQAFADTLNEWGVGLVPVIGHGHLLSDLLNSLRLKDRDLFWPGHR